MVGLIVAVMAVLGYFGTRSVNPTTGETQYVGITTEQEVALGLQAAPEMAAQHGGLHPDERGQALVDRVGEKLLRSGKAGASGYPFDFHLLADEQTINAFALPGGQVFITQALLARLTTEGQLAGVLGHEIGHVVGRHSAERIAKQQLTEGLTGAVVISTYDPNDPASARTAQMAALIGGLVNMRFGRQDELESDALGVQYMADADYDPRAMIEVMKILAESSQGGAPPEFFSTHPNPDNRVARIESAIQQRFPNGVPTGLTP
ncbi:MAG: M48 family metalloprotease [Gemmatimonadaceae bacterium]